VEAINKNIVPTRNEEMGGTCRVWS